MDPLAENGENYLRGGALAECGVTKWLGAGASGADGAEVEWAVATTAEVFDGDHFAGAKLALSLRSFGDLSFGALRDAAIPHGQSTPHQPPKALAKHGLLFGIQDGFGANRGAKLTHKGGSVPAYFGAVRRRGLIHRPIAVRAKVGIYRPDFWQFGPLSGVN